MYELLKDGLTIAGIGMGFVISFLCVLIFAMVIMSEVLKQINKICPEAVEEVQQPKRQQAAKDDSMIAAVIAAAKRGL